MDLQDTKEVDIPPKGAEPNQGGDGKQQSMKQANTPFAQHVEENKENSKASTKELNDRKSTSVQSALGLKAPYAQPVLDASKLKRSTVDDRIALVRERRLQHQQALEREANLRKVKDELNLAKWEQSQEERKKKMEENKDKEENRRKEVELRKKQKMDDVKKRAEAIVARTEQQANVVLRQKRNTSADRTKRWSWGAGGCGGGGGIAYATNVDTAPGPFHYFDANRMTKHQPSSGDEEKASSSKSSFGSLGFGSPSATASRQQQQTDDRFSKSPLVVSTVHLAFASGLRSYDSSPTQTASKSPAANSPRSRRARSSDTRAKTCTPSAGSQRSSSAAQDDSKSTTTSRGRSPGGVRRSASLKLKKGGSSTSPQLTEPLAVSSRLLAPTQASLARSKQAETEEVPPVRSRSSDRKLSRERPSSARSDSSGTSTQNSPRAPISTTPKSRPIGRTPSPSLYKPRTSNKAPEPSVSSPNLSQKSRPQSPQLRSGPKRPPSPVAGRSSLNTKENRGGRSSRGVSPARQSPVSSRPSSASSKRTPASTDSTPTSTKSTPPVIKQTLRPNLSSTRPKTSPNSAKTKPTVKKEPKAETKKQKEKKDQPQEGVKTEARKTDTAVIGKKDEEIAATPAVQKLHNENTSTEENILTPTAMVETVTVVEVKSDDAQVSEQISVIEAPSKAQDTVVENPASLSDEKLEIITQQKEQESDETKVSSTHVEASTSEDKPLSDVDSIENEVRTSLEEKTQEQSLLPLPDEEQPKAKDEDTGANEKIKPDPPLDVEVSQEREEVEPSELAEEVKSSDEQEKNDADAAASESVEDDQDTKLVSKEEVVVEKIEDVASVSEIVVESDVEDTKPQFEQNKILESDNNPVSIPIALSDKNVEVEEQDQERDEESTTQKSAEEISEVSSDQKVDAGEELVEVTAKEDEMVVPEQTENVVSSSFDAEEEEKVAEQKAPISEQKTDESSSLSTKEDAKDTGEEIPTPSLDHEEVSVSSLKDKQEAKMETEKDETLQTVTEAKAPAAAAEPKKKEKKISPEEQAYKEALAAKRREAKEKREREEQERQERKKLEAEERAKRVEIARRMAEEARIEEEKRLEEERRLQEEQELKKKQEAEEQARKHEEEIRLQKEKIEQRAKEEADKSRKERELAAQKKEEERLQRKKRLEMIMRRTRGGESPTPNSSPSNPTPSGGNSPSNQSPSGGRSPHNSVTPDRVISPVTVETSPQSFQSNTEHPALGQGDVGSAQNDVIDIPTIQLPEQSSTTQNIKTAPPAEAFADDTLPADGVPEGFVAISDQNSKIFDPLLNGEDQEKLVINGTENGDHNSFVDNPFVKVPTGSLVEF